MKEIRRGVQALDPVPPLEVAAYLHSRGWKQSELLAGKGSAWIFVGKDGSKFEVLLPMSRDLTDFHSRIEEVLHVLEVVETHETGGERSRSEIVADITTVTADVLRFRFDDADGGTLPIEEGVRVVEHVRNLILAAACATVQPRQQYQTRKPAQATEYLSRVRIGAPERGSFVLAIRSEVPPRLVSQSPLDLVTVEEPFERRVMLTLAQAVIAARDAACHAGAIGDLQPFRDAVQRGVSSNLCDAIAGLARGSRAESVTMTFSWAPARIPSGKPPERIFVSSDVAPVLQEAARFFRGAAPLEDFELRGMVVKLERPEGIRDGRITVAALVDESIRRVQLELTAGDYAQAIHAHEREQPIYCEGELTREGRGYVLHNPRAFRVESDPDTASPADA